MGLDMYMRGERYPFGSKKNGWTKPMEEGFEVVTVTLELGYWRKHPNLHGYIVQTFADGVDECQRIRLSKDNLIQIRKAVSVPSSLPVTSGFFFGQSYGTQQEADEDVAIIDKAIAWLDAQSDDECRQVYYQASW